MTEQELLKHLMEFFPTEGSVMGVQELKYNIIMKYADLSKEEQKEKLNEFDELLEKLNEEGILNKFEFNNTVNYKAKQEIPINLGGSSSSKDVPSPSTNDAQLSALSDLVVALAEESDNSQVKTLLDKYKAEYL